MLVGPYVEFADYMNLIDGTLFKSLEKDADEKRAAARVPGRLVPRGRKRVAYRKMATGLAFLGAFVVLGGQYNFSIALQDSFPKRSLLYRYAKPCVKHFYSPNALISIGIYQICGFFERTKYYAIWTLTEVSGTRLDPQLESNGHL